MVWYAYGAYTRITYQFQDGIHVEGTTDDTEEDGPEYHIEPVGLVLGLM